MPTASPYSCFSVYHSVLEPWTRLAAGAPDVINLRMTAMPWLWLLDPAKAMAESQRMVTEKHDAWNETMLAICHAPMHIWFETLGASWSRAPHVAFNEAVINSSRRVARPSNSRVRANRSRLSG
ncbi:hypothetical protein ACUNV4_07800 [Granulosicoccus sp. 3-233]|uniref:hypothetical protein n=1 Tax=Granulosicoccus sp. 3-233 TaxID=3417969 RepID=UPI003D34D8DD